MRNPHSSDTHKLLLEVTQCVQMHGVDGTVNILSSARQKKHSTLFIDFVTDMVCSKYGFTLDQLTSNNNNNNKRVLALRFISFYCRNHGIKGLKISFAEIANKLRRTRQLVEGYCSEMSKKKKDNKDVLQKYFKEFDAQVKAFTNEQRSRLPEQKQKVNIAVNDSVDVKNKKDAGAKKRLDGKI